MLFSPSHVKFPDFSGAPDHVSFDVKQAGLIGDHTPANDLNFAAGYFDAAHTGRINAAPRVEVREFFRLRIFVTVCMSADQHLLSFRDPLVAVLLDLMLLVEILDGTGRVLKSEGMKAPPEIFEGKHRQPP